MTDEQTSLLAAAVAVAAAPRLPEGPQSDIELADRVAALARSLYADLRSSGLEREHLHLIEQLAAMSSSFEGSR